MIMALLLLAGSLVSAQDNPPPPPDDRPVPMDRQNIIGEVLRVIEDETGLSLREVLSDISEGATLADVITSNGGDVDAVIQAVMDRAQERIDRALENGRMDENRAATLMENLETSLRDAINDANLPETLQQRIQERENNMVQVTGMRILLRTIQSETDVNLRDMLAGVREGSTPAEIVTEAGGDVDAIISAAVATATEQINEMVANERLSQERAGDLLADLETIFTDMMNTVPDARLMGPPERERGNRPGRPGGDNDNRAQPVRDVLNRISEQTGLDTPDILSQMREGTSPAAILEANDVSVDDFVAQTLAPLEDRLNEAVTSGDISQAVADARLNLRRVELIDWLNRVPEMSASNTDPAGDGS